MSTASIFQQRWREGFELRHRIRPPKFRSTTNQTEGANMAQIVKLPARSNAIDYSEDAILDVYDSLSEAEQGEGVVIDDAQDSESKARVRCRTMAAKLKEGATDDSGEVTRDKVNTRTHVVPQGEDPTVYLPVLSLKE